ncbi:MAG: bifunctional 4-hydroxy-2-oxoglutarate aldolase/2-dehydro-3-deoxy-phosphogluconate aldolase [bacterium]
MDRILKKRVVPVVVLDDLAAATPLVEALMRAGQDVMEITFRTAAAPLAVKEIRRVFPQVLIGAGTLLTSEQVEQAVAAGALFGVSPGLNEKVIEKARALKLPMIPGVMTPSEVEKAMALGCKLLKFFPAELAGGAKMLQAFWGPYAHTGVRFVPLGGINTANMGQYLALPAVAAIGGSWMVDKKLIAAKEWGKIETLSREALQVAAAVSKA